MPLGIRKRVSLHAALLALTLLPLAGCSYFRQRAAERYVYVTAKQTFLRDRVAAVSNRTGTVSNGEKLVVLERARRFLKVRTPRGEVGWIQEKLTADQHTADQFQQLASDHEKDPVVATAVARDEVYLHLTPGRETDRFYRLAEGDQLSLLGRAAVPKVIATTGEPAAKPKPAASDVHPEVRPDAHAEPHSDASTSARPAADEDPAARPNAEATPGDAPPAVMEDWWLVRNARGQTGWIYSRMIDVSAPDALVRYAEGQRIVGTYLLAKVDDPDSGVLDNGQVVTAIPEYLALLGPYKAGLPFDFDQVRVFVWNLKKHRYETGFRESKILGYLPVKVEMAKDPYSNLPANQVPAPTFAYSVLAADAPIPSADPATGMVKPAHLIHKTYRVEGEHCRLLLPAGQQLPPEAHPIPEPPKDKSGKGKHRKR